MAAEEHFNWSIQRNVEGRCKVSSMIQGHLPLWSDRNIAERRLKACGNSLKKTGTLEAYEPVLIKWIYEDLIK